MTPILLPALGAPAVVSLWHVQPGERVFAGDRVVEVLIPGAAIAVAAPITGTVRERIKQPNDRVDAGDVLGMME
ncbi:MAG TPA: lipoyl domain-containing protein [Urbifossiella sp.]|jgi:pyruvate/2-oxoglutarate dehydrogenase complex dihydrolipoamide acyltransferase (E2) component|nr:lipoyl domain-containing protein [Urbifossiella sp.]